jgi:transketolase C-terminal domain/subunit
MTYENLINTVSVIVENEKILKEGLTLVYELEEKNHKAMNEILFYKSNPNSAIITPTDIFEVEIGGVLIKFTKKV